MTTATATKTSTYHITIPVETYIWGSIEAPADLSRDEVIKLITWETTETFESQESFKAFRSAALDTVEVRPIDVDIEEETND